MDELGFEFDPNFRYDLTSFMSFMQAHMGLELLKPIKPSKGIQTQIYTANKSTQTDKPTSVLWGYFN
jgi:hypothetical protein